MCLTRANSRARAAAFACSMAITWATICAASCSRANRLVGMSIDARKGFSASSRKANVAQLADHGMELLAGVDDGPEVQSRELQVELLGSGAVGEFDDGEPIFA